MSSSPKRVVMVGCGGIGSWLARGVAMTLEYQAPGSALILVDGDSYEPKNKNRQVFSAMGNKARSLANDLRDGLTQTIVIAHAAWIVSPEVAADEDAAAEETEGISRISAEALLEDGDVVFPVVDNHAARKLIFDAAAKLDNIDVFSGGNDDQLGGSIYHYRRRDGHDITVHPAVRAPEFQNPPDRNPGEMSCAERAQLDGGTQLLAANLCVTAGLMAYMSTYIIGEGADATQLPISEIHFDMKLGIWSPYDRTLLDESATTESAKVLVTR